MVAYNTREIRPLTGLRGLAAFLVFIFHFYGSQKEASGFGQFPLFLAQVGWSGVTIFFTLSGFLLTALYYEKFKNRITLAEFKSYLLKRFARIYPVYFFLTLLLFAYAIFRRLFQNGPPINILDWTSHWTMTHGFLDWYFVSIIPAAWSLTVEELFYFLLPFLCWLGARIRWGILFIPPLFWGIGILLVQLPGETIRFVRNWPDSTLFGQSTVFLMGSLLGFFLRKQIKSAQTIAPQWSYFGWTLGIAFYCLGGWIWKDRLSWMEGFQGQIIFGLCAVFLIFGTLGQSLLSRFFGSTPMVYLGRISYAFYLSHGLVLTRLTKVGLDPSPLLSFFACILISAFLYEGIEKPMRTFLTSA